MLHDYHGGTYQWLERTLNALKYYHPKQIILLQHHPFSSTPSKPSFVSKIQNNN